MRYGKLLVVLSLIAPALAACASPQAMTVENTAVANSNPKYRNAMTVRSVTGGQVMNALTIMGVANEPFQTALEGSLAASGYLARTGTPKFYIDAKIVNLDQPIIGLDMDVTATVNYEISGSGGTPVTYPIRTTARATFSDSPIAADRIRVANERAMYENIKLFMQSLR
jgi:hypothetical protein